MTSINQTGRTNTGIFGLESTFEEAEIGFIAVPWDATSSYKAGSHQSPDRILAASPQLDFFHPDFAECSDDGIVCLDANPAIIEKNSLCRKAALKVIKAHEVGEFDDKNPALHKALKTVNEGSIWLNDIIYQQAERCIQDNKLIGLIGGDHSCTYPLVKALVDYIDSFTILQIDAHMDLRPAYQGFNFSHASVMHNCLKHKDIKRLVQVGVRDYCAQEKQVQLDSGGRIKTFYDQDLKEERFAGKTWDSQCKKIVNNCADNVYVTVDMDGLMPQYCPNTGTVVPGGLDFSEVTYLMKQLVKSKRTIVGFDVVEANGEPDSVDIISAMRMCYQLAGYAWLSHQDHAKH